ncbi:hypothetical protein BTVI_38942 [Pitangus sulphuratus]|nr:hypothetical protein BTVI_38942 [Pitangus sulphuratus]
MSKMPPECEWFSVIDLKDAFWTFPLDENSRDIFAFEWEDQNTGRRQQLRWTVLPQGFSEAPNLFGQTLETVMCKFDSEEGITILQYVDDLLIVGKEQFEELTVRLFNFLGEQGLRVSKSKLQFVEKEVKYLGHIIRKDPAQFLYGQKETEHSETEHNCLDVIDYQTKAREDVMDVPIKERMHLFTVGSSKVIEGKRKSGYAVVDGEDFMVVESGTVRRNWSAQACEVHAVISALHIISNGIGTIYTDSRYAWGVAHVFGKIWHETGMMTSQGKELGHRELIETLLEEVQ